MNTNPSFKLLENRFGLWVGLVAVALIVPLSGCGGSGSTTSGGTGTGGTGSGGGGGETGGGGSGSGGGTGILPADVIFYSDIDAATGDIQIRYIKPDKTGDTLYATLSQDATTGATYVALAPDSKNASNLYFAYQASADAAIGIYKNSKVNIAGATEIVPPTYSYISNMTLSPDGTTLAFIGAVDTAERRLVKVAVTGTTSPVVLDSADQAAVSPTGDLIVYSKGYPADLYVRPLVATGVARRLTSTTDDDVYPSFSRDGTRVLFSAGSAGVSDLYSLRVSDGGDRKQITNTPGLSELGATYNNDGTLIACYAQSDDDSTKTGLYRMDATGGNAVQLKASPSIGQDVYWTSTSGRGSSVSIGFKLNPTKRRPKTNQPSVATPSATPPVNAPR